MRDPPGGYRQFLRVALRAGPALCALCAVCALVSAGAPLVVAAAVGGVIGHVPALTAHGLGSSAGRAALWWAVVAGLCLLLLWIAGSLRTATATALGDRIDAALQRDLMDAVMAPQSIAHLEQPKTLDLVNVGRETFRGSWGRPGRLAATISGLATGQVMLLGSCLLLARFHLLLGAAFLMVGLWAAHEEKAASRVEAAHHYGSSEAARRLDYFYELGATPPAAKEVRVFGLSGFLHDRFTDTWRRSMDQVLTPLPIRPLSATAALACVVLAGLGWVAADAAAGRLSAGSAAVLAQALAVGVAGVQQASWTGLQTELALATLVRYGEAVAVVREAGSSTTTGAGLPADGLPGKEIRFQGVSFRYPGSSGAALQDLDLVVPAGRSLAVVGVNGAGKTTLVKLLCRLYEPTSGRITVDGADLAVLDPVAWRQRVAAVFQDATRFALTARDNVAFGHVGSAADEDGIRAAAATAGVADVIDSLPAAWNTVLSAEFPDGADLSGGQWHKVALARALYAVDRGAGVLVLDEPAAHLDARAEARLHEQFLELTEGLTTIVISHRFSTVRQASSIAVLDGGRVVEQGTHDELTALGGAYADMFRVQAARFRESDDTAPEQQEVPQP
ncbi:ABC transporter ATP-binding protein [Streptacidiphilus sp. PB12-B1b]|uniref:ABC transporter ATP-binding protein n=1 Tax=Streptacidiphilus sp. PB12-B1b TaxID=2705012 RepID=UPI0015FCDBAC|nr:ABC transporter ATP-binding protein [Streptacidiphilus sp. PB12-B1b]QMU78267.1 ABC transporter ATP-binding protein [Streptacidiphilus sp. PB12-B1b]